MTQSDFVMDYSIGTKRAAVFERNGIYEVDFFSNDDLVGTVAYPDNNIHYVVDAAHNFVEGILTEEVVKKYKKV